MKKIRLHDNAYRAGDAFSVTIATHLRRPYFLRPEAYQIALAAVREAAAKYEAHIFAYCFMPNHVHLLTATPPETPATKFLDRFKQLAGYRLKRALSLSDSVWQERYFDHGLRAEEDLQDVANYIWQNPVRAGIVAQAQEYPYSGSLEFPDLFSSGAEAPDLRRKPTLMDAANSTTSGAEAPDLLVTDDRERRYQ